MEIKTLIVQNNAIIGNKKATFDNAYQLIESYINEKPDIIVFPEVWSVGWFCQIFPEQSEGLETSETIDFLKTIAIESKALVIGGSFIQKCEGFYKNTCPVISKTGKLITTYDKMHLFSHKGSEENKYIKTGDKLKIINYKGTKIGLSICYDIRFPEIYREYSRNGVEVFVNMAAWSNKKLDHWNIMHRARAIENQCFMLVADQTGKISQNEYNLGHSMLINPWGDIEESLKEEESCLLCKFNTSKVKELRKNFPLIADRRDNNCNMFKIEEININE